jgi:hypothetical protein
MRTALLSAGIDDVLNIAMINNYYHEWNVRCVFEDSRLQIVYVSNSLSDYLYDNRNTNSATFRFPKSNIYWNRNSVTYDDWKSISNQYDGIYVYDTNTYVTAGNYNAGSLSTAINSAFQIISNSYNIPQNSLELSLFESTFKSQLFFAPANSNPGNGWRIYFKNNKSVSEMGFSLSATYYTLTSGTIQSNSLVNVNGAEIIYLNCPTFPSMSISSHKGGTNNSCICKLNLGSVPIGHTFYYKNSSDSLLTFDDNYSDITTLNFFLSDINGNEIDLNNIDWTMTFLIYT